MDNTTIAPILGRLPSGLFIITARRGEQETGMLASWVMQAGFEPPMLTVAMSLKRYVNDWLTDGASFAVNVLGADQRKLLSHFGRGFAPEEPAFNGLAIERTPAGLAILTEALGHLECQVRGEVASADHRILLAEITAGKLHREADPLVHIRNNGLKY
jgi:flavin reductase (DIM6/NTAB) family NADH-FMN oxidoreductase RutF